MRGDEFRIYDPFARQRKKRTGSASDFGILYEQGVDKPAIAKLVEAGRRTERRRGERDEAVIEERAEWIDARARTNAANATYGDKPFAPRDFAAEQRIDLRLLGSAEFNSPTILRAPPGTEEREYQDANAAFGLPDYEAVMAIPERRKTPRPAKAGSSFGQFRSIGADDQLRGGIGSDLLSANAAKAPAEPEASNKYLAKTLDAFERSNNRAQPARIYYNKELRPGDDDRVVESTAKIGGSDARGVGPYFNPNGDKYNEVPKVDLRGWNGTDWYDDIPFFTDGVKRKLSSRYGWRYLSERRPKDFHAGIDIAAIAGTPVVSAHAGTVAKVFKENGEYGVVINGDDGKLYTYYHINPVEFMARGRKLAEDERVEIGDSLGRVRDRKEKGSHLHFACHDPEKPKAPNKKRWEGRSDANSCNPFK